MAEEERLERQGDLRATPVRDLAARESSENPVTILEELAEYCRTAGEYSSAIEYYHQILGLAERAARSAEMVAATCRKLAACLLDAGNPAGALRVLSRPEAAHDDDPAGRAATLALTAEAHFAAGQPREAEDCARDTLRAAKGVAARAAGATAHRILGEVLVARRDLDEARRHVEAARVLSDEAEDARSGERSRMLLARLAREEGGLAEALAHGGALAAGAGDPKIRAAARALVAEVRLLQGRFADAIEAAREAEALGPAPIEASLARAVRVLALRAVGSADGDESAAALDDLRAAVRGGGDAAASALKRLLFIDALREAARAGGGAVSLPIPLATDDPIAGAASEAVAMLARLAEDRLARGSQAQLATALGRLRDQGAHDPLASLLMLAASLSAAHDPDACDGALAEAIRIFRETGRARDLIRAHLARARCSLGREAHADALRILETAAQIAREEGIDEDAAELQSLRSAIDDALARLGSRQLGNLTEFNELIRGLRLLDAPSASLKRLVEVAIEWSQADAAVLLLESAEGGWSALQLVAAPGEDREALVELAKRVSRAMTAEGGRPFASSGGASDARLAPLLEESAVAGAPSWAGALLAAPLVAEGRVIGALVVLRRARGAHFAGEAFALLVALATVASSIASDLRGEEMRRENLLLRQRLGLEGGFETIITQNARMIEIIDTLKRASAGSTTVLLQGETGTGKELLARAVHQHGLARRGGSFVTVSCSELTQDLLESELFGHTKGSFTGAVEEKKGLFEIADGGTVFLDQIDKTTRDFQEALLRVVDRREIKPVGSAQSRVVDVRIICASNVELKRAVEEGRFLKDLYYRLRVIAITIPPLRERSEDIALLAEHFLRSISRRFGKSLRGFSPETMKRLVAYPWPGNVRDLENEVERFVALAPDGEEIGPELLSPETGGGAFSAGLAGVGARPLGELLEEIERGLVLDALVACRGNRSHAARRLGLSRRGLLNKIERFGLGEVGRSAARAAPGGPHLT